MIVVVEPHADDAFLSLGGHLLRWRADEVPTAIVTVYGDDRRLDEARRYAASVGADHIAIGRTEQGGGRAGDEVERLPRCEITATLGERYGDDLAARCQVIYPAGIGHPEHRAVAALATPRDWRYVEVPYSITTDLAGDTTRAITERRIVSWLRPNARKYAASSIFASQSQFFYFNRERLRHAVEVVVV